MGFSLWQAVGVTVFFHVDISWPSTIYWRDHPFSTFLWCQLCQKSNDCKHMTCFRTLFRSIVLSIMVTIPHYLWSFYIKCWCLVVQVLPLCSPLGFSCGLCYLPINFRISALVVFFFLNQTNPVRLLITIVLTLALFMNFLS